MCERVWGTTVRDRADEVVRLAGAVVSRIKSEVPEGRRHLICSHSWRTAVPCEEIQQAKHTGTERNWR